MARIRNTYESSYIWMPNIKIHVRRAAGRGYSYFHLYMGVGTYLFVCHASWQTKNDTDLKFSTHIPRDHI